MITCPNCQKPVSGRPRACGYCGTSLVQDYFKEREFDELPSASAGGVAATVLGVFGAVAVLGAAVFQLMVLLRGELPFPSGLTLIWWLRMITMTLFAPVFFVQLLVLRGVRLSLVFDGFWLFTGVCGLGMTLQGYLDKGAAAFYGQSAIAYLLVVGCTLAIVSCITGILSTRSVGRKA